MTLVSYQLTGRVAVVTIHRPDRRNAVDGPTAKALADAFRQFDADAAADVAVLQGEGDCFCAGADLKALASVGSGSGSGSGSGQGNRIEPDGDGPMGPTRMQLSKPVIAAIEGHAVAGGLELALWCDLRVMAEDAVMGVYCRRFGVPLVDGGTVRLPRLIGQSRAMDLILSGRAVQSAEAFSIGLANRVVGKGQALDSAIQWAQQLSAFPQTCMRNDRLSVLAQWGCDEGAALQNETRLGLGTLASGETLDGAGRFTAGQGRHGVFAAD
jgi:enoyl-CoA hydratase